MQSSSRNGARVRLLAIHTTEGILQVNDLRNWSKWPGSSHATADQYGGFLDGPADGFVDYSRASWTLRSGNPISDNIELCGFAKWTRAEWLARPKLLESASLWLARRKKARPDIPLVKLTPEQVRAGRAGVIGHNDWTVGMKDGSHWDPGPGFPWDVVLTRANALASNTPGSPITTLPAPAPVEDPLSALTDAEQRELLDTLRNVKGYLYAGGPSVDAGTGSAGSVFGRVLRLDRQMTGAQGTPNSVAARVIDIQAALTRDLPTLVAGASTEQVVGALVGLSDADVLRVARAANDEADRRDRERLNQPT